MNSNNNNYLTSQLLNYLARSVIVFYLCVFAGVPAAALRE